MTAYNAPKVAAGVQPKWLPSAGGVNVLSIQSQTTTLAANDTINMIQLSSDPALGPSGGPTVIGVVFDVDQLDTGGSAALKLSVGDSSSATRYYSSLTLAQTGGYATPTQSAILGYQPFSGTFFSTYTTVSYATYTVVVKCNVSAQTWANGNIRLLFEYTMDP